MGLQQFERRLERLVEGAFAKAFRSGLQPVEIGRRMTREMDLQRTVAPRGTIAPNQFTVMVGPTDRARFEPFETELITELVGVAKEHAKVENYVFLGAVSVELSTDPEMTPGMLEVIGEMRGPAGGAAQLVLPDGSRHPLGTTPVTIGRLPECDVVLSDANASRRHVEVRPATDGTGGYVVVDLGSTNGTKVNGVGIRSHRLSDGDDITIGATHLRFEAH
jgi:hypothetical protein